MPLILRFILIWLYYKLIQHESITKVELQKFKQKQNIEVLNDLSKKFFSDHGFHILKA
jgi:hypothetical protein